MEALLDFCRRVWFVCCKEFLEILKEKHSWKVLFLPLFIQTFLFGYICNLNIDHVTYAVLDEAHSATSRRFLSLLDGSGIFYRTRMLANAGQIDGCIDDDAAMVVIAIKSDFEARLRQGKKAEIQVINDGRNATTAAAVSHYLAKITHELNKELHGGRELINLASIVWYNPNNITRWTPLVAMMPMLCLFQVIILASVSISKEKENGTFDQLLVTPLGSSVILLGKALPAFILAMLQSAIGLIICRYWFKVPLNGPVWLIFLALIIFFASAVGVGLIVSAAFRTMQQAVVYCILIFIPWIGLSGFFTPVHNMSKLLQYATYLNPLRFALNSVRRIYLEGCGFSAVWPDFVPMLAVACVTLPLADWMFRHKNS